MLQNSRPKFLRLFLKIYWSRWHLAEVFQVDLSLTSYVFIVTMALAASIGFPATLGVGIPAAGIALILGVGRILDMCRPTCTSTTSFGRV